MKVKKQSTQFGNLLSNKLINQYIDKTTNISELARKVEVTPNLMWLYVKGQRKWPVETWLKALSCLGAMDIYSDGISIECDINKSTYKKYAALAK